MSQLQAATSYDAKVDITQNILESVTGGKVDRGRAAAVLDVFLEFSAFVESGESFKSLQTQAYNIDDVPLREGDMRTMATFASFAQSRGGALVQNEMWAILAFLYWANHGYALIGKERAAYDKFKHSVRAHADKHKFTMTQDTIAAVGEMVSAIMERP